MEKGKCRDCGVDILWVRTANGRLMPLDAEPVADGNLVLVNGVPTLIRGDLSETVPEGPRYKSHFVTCIHADKFRKKMKGK